MRDLYLILSSRFLLPGLLLAGVLALSGCASMQGPADSDTFIFLDESEPLYVEFLFTGDLRMKMDHPEIADYEEERRREDYLASIQQVLAEVRLPLEVHVLGRDEEAGSGPLLRLEAYRWDIDGFGQIELTLAAKLMRFGELNTLGTFRAKEMRPLVSSPRELEAVYRQVMHTVLVEVMGELAKHFATPEEAAFMKGAAQP